MTLSFILCKPIKKMPLSSLIMDGENVEFSHVAIKLDNEIYHAKFPKFRKQSYEDFKSFYTEVKAEEFIVPIEKRLDLKFSLEDFVGKPYSVLQLFLIGLGLFSKSLNKRISLIKLNNKRALICSEAAAIIMIKYFGVDFKESIDTIGLREVELMLKTLKSEEINGNIWLP